MREELGQWIVAMIALAVVAAAYWLGWSDRGWRQKEKEIDASLDRMLKRARKQ